MRARQRLVWSAPTETVDRPRMRPSDLYQGYVATPGFVDDPAQRAILPRLDDLQRRLRLRDEAERRLVGRIARRIGRSAPAEKGLYLWGGVGRGKTFLMDLFFDSLPLERKLRTHFHRFMQRVHRELTRLTGNRDPLDIVAATLAAETGVLCFDEFFVADIGDAMLLGELFDCLFARGVALVATSNVAPDRLYWNGLQRQRFLPAIEAIEQRTDVVEIGAGDDYRLRMLERAEIYHQPLDADADRVLARNFEALAPDLSTVENDVDIEIEGRMIRCRRLGDDVAWFDFAALCDGPRSQLDYIEIARICHAVLLSGVPIFRPHLEDQARRFISLVDEFYDRNVKLIVSAEGPISALYQGERHKFEFARTASRLLEMQSLDYLGGTHLA